MSRNTQKQPLRPAGILFALAANVLMVTSTSLLLGAAGWGSSTQILATAVAPVLAGILTALYVKQRGAMHAFLGAIISVPILTFIVFGGIWQLGVLAGAFCTLGGAFTEILLRRQGQTG